MNCKNSIAARKAAQGKAIDLKKAASVRAKEMKHRRETIQNLAVNPLLQHQLVNGLLFVHQGMAPNVPLCHDGNRKIRIVLAH